MTKLKGYIIELNENDIIISTKINSRKFDLTIDRKKFERSIKLKRVLGQSKIILSEGSCCDIIISDKGMFKIEFIEPITLTKEEIEEIDKRAEKLLRELNWE